MRARLAVSLFSLFIVALPTVFLSCGGDGSTTEPDPQIASVEVSPSASTLSAIGDTRQFGAVARDGSGSPISGVTFSWSSSDASVATVNSSGVATARGNGETAIRATADGVSGDAALTVSQEVSSVEVSPSAATLSAVGATQQYDATLLDANGNQVTGASVSWSSSDASVATVDADGLATAQGDGEATITAMADGVSGDATLTVSQEVSSVEVSPSAATLSELDATEQFTATALDSEGNVVDGVSFQWSSSDTTTATVDQNGVASSVREGAVDIEAAVGGVTGTASLAVDLPPGMVIWVDPTGGLWSEPLNWSCKCVPGVGDDVFVSKDGTYTVTVDVDGDVKSMEVGASSGSQVLWIGPGKLLQLSDSSTTKPNGVVEVIGGELGGAGKLGNKGRLHLGEGRLSVPLGNDGILEVKAATGASGSSGGSTSPTALAALNPGQSELAAGLTTTAGSSIKILGDEDLSAGGSAATLTVAEGFVNRGTIELVTDAPSSETRLDVQGTGKLENRGVVTGKGGAGTGTNKLGAVLENTGAVRVEGERLQIDLASATHVNDGSVEVTGGELVLTQSGTGPTFSNRGTLQVGTGTSFVSEGGTLIHATGSVIQGTGTLRLQDAALDLQADLVNQETLIELLRSRADGSGQLTNDGTVVLKDGSRVRPPFKNRGTLLVRRSGTDAATVLQNRIEGLFETEATSVIQVGDPADVGTEAVSPTVLEVADGFQNHGVLELVTESNASEARIHVEGTGLLENLGEIVNRSPGGDLGQNLMDVALKNSGDLRMAEGRLRLDKVDAEHTNEANGRVLVDQGEFRLKLTGLSPVFTNKGTATLDISAGASLVTDEGNLINETGGIIQGDGTLAVEQAGVSLAEALTVTGTIRMSDGTLTGPSLVSVQGTLELEGTSTVDVPVEVADGGTMELHAPTVDPTLQTSVEMFASLTTNPLSTVRLLADGSGGTVLTLGPDLTNEGTLELVNGSAGGEALLEAGSTATSSLVNNGELVSRATGASGTNRIDANLTNGGSVRVPSQTLIVSPSFVDANHDNQAGATMVVGEGGGAAAELALTGASPESIDNFGTMTVHASSRVVLGASTLNEKDGLLEGDGTIEAQVALRSLGTIRPGIGGPGVLTVDGDLTLDERICLTSTCDPSTDAISQLDMEVGGGTVGSEHDQLVITGQGDLTGRLEIIQIDGFVPVEGDQFEVMEFASKLNDFSSVGPTDVQGDETGLEWSSSSTATQFFLDVIRP